MSQATPPLPRLTAAEYLAWERVQRDKYQYLGGQVFAMAGGSPRHNRLGMRVLSKLDAALGGGPCGAFSSDQKIFVPATGDFVYPDGSVVCGAVVLHEGTPDVIENPKVVIEVLSKSTERHDRGEKWDDYRSIPTLSDYVLVSQRIAQLEHYARQDDGAWTYRAVRSGDRLELTTGTVLAVDEIYQGAFDIPGDG